MIVGSFTSMLRTTRLIENLSSSIAEDAKVDSVGAGDCEDETVKRSPLTSMNSNGATGYLIPALSKPLPY